MAAYQDVLVVPVPQSEQPNKAELEAIRRAEAKEDQRILSSLEDRLCDPSDIQSHSPKFQSALHRILLKAHDIVSRVESTRNRVLNTESTDKTPNFLPISILSIRECQALVRTSVSLIIFLILYFFQALTNDLVESEGRASCRTCIGNNEGMTYFRGSVVSIELLCRELVYPYPKVL